MSALAVRTLAVATLSLSALLAGACGGAASDDAEIPPAALVGDWRAVLASPGGDLPFTLRIGLSAGSELYANAVNGAEEAPFSTVTVEGDRLVLAIDWYDSTIEARVSEPGSDGVRRLDGEWRKTVPEGVSSLAFSAVQDEPRRFLPAVRTSETPAAAGTLPSVDGSWAVVFTDEEGSQKALGELHQTRDRITGTFLTPTGDYRFLEGEYRDGLLRLSTFDGAHAFLFEARAQPDGTLEGDFWSRESYHATWTARRLGDDSTDEPVLPDPYDLVHLSHPEGRFDFRFPDLDGRAVSLSDPRFRGKVVLVNIFGSWCPNCNDEAVLLSKWYRRYRDRGLEIVGLAFELIGDPERDSEMVRKFARRHDIEYPLLLAGTSDKAEAAKTLPHLDRVVAYPTTVFLDRTGEVRRIHSGFAGPGTGEHHDRLVRELERLIENLLAEPAPAPAAPSPTTAVGG